MLLLSSLPWEPSDTDRSGALGLLVLLRLKAPRDCLLKWEGLLLEALLAVELRCLTPAGLLCLLRLLKAVVPVPSALQAPRGA